MSNLQIKLYRRCASVAKHGIYRAAVLGTHGVPRIRGMTVFPYVANR